MRDRAKVCLKSWNRTLPDITAIPPLAANRVIFKDKIKIRSLDEVAVGRDKRHDREATIWLRTGHSAF